MYIFILEGCKAVVSATCNDKDMGLCVDGVLDVIDTSGDIPLRYYNGSWHKLERINDDD